MLDVRVVIVGGGVSGLGSALTLARQGHQVTIVERDDTPMPATADEAFEWDRRGAPQVRHSHAFLARLVALLRTRYPDVYEALLREGATELRFGEGLPPTITDFTPQLGDDELTMLACRRTTFEWVLRRFALDEGNVTLRTGVAVDGLLAEPADVPTVTGVRLSDGTIIGADLTVVATGRRSALPEWLAEVGAAPIEEHVDDTGIVYFSRFYRLLPDAEYPPRIGAIGGDLGYLKFGVFVGDNRSFSITLATPVDDDEMRKLLADPTTFDQCGRLLTATAPWLDGRAEAITPGVHAMAGLINRWREYVVDGAPRALGVVPVGDAILCTNPLYGRGCSTAFWGASLLGDAVEVFDDDPYEIVRAYDASLRAEIYPWYRSSVQQDAEARRVADALLHGQDPDGDTSDPRTFQRAVLRDGLLPALRSDATVLRAFLRNLNLLTAPDALANDPDIGTRVLTAWQERDQRPPEPPLGPARRADLVAVLAG